MSKQSLVFYDYHDILLRNDSMCRILYKSDYMLGKNILDNKTYHTLGMIFLSGFHVLLLGSAATVVGGFVAIVAGEVDVGTAAIVVVGVVAMIAELVAATVVVGDVATVAGLVAAMVAACGFWIVCFLGLSWFQTMSKVPLEGSL